MKIQLFFSTKTRRAASIAAALIAFTIVCEHLTADPATPATDQGATNDGSDNETPVPETPEPKEYGGVGGGASAMGVSSIYSSGGDTCWPIPPTGSITISGDGEIILDEKIISSLVIGDGGSKPDFDWTPNPIPPNPKPKTATPSTSWNCAGSAEFQTGFSYAVSADLHDTIADCGAVTTVARPPNITGPFLEWANTEKTAGTIYFPRIKTEATSFAALNPNWWRKKVGAGENLICDLLGVPQGATVTWAVSDPSCTINSEPSDSTVATFIAGDQQTTATITASFVKGSLQGSASVTVNVLIPTSETARKLAQAEWPADATVLQAGQQGVYMYLEFTLQPRIVSFGKLEFKELESDAVNFTGIIKELVEANAGMAAGYAHRGQGRIDTNWVGIGDDNIAKKVDTVGYNDELPTGSWEWVIPVKWHIKDKPTEHDLPDRHQVFEVLDNDGTSKVSKLGQSETRSK